MYRFQEISRLIRSKHRNLLPRLLFVLFVGWLPLVLLALLFKPETVPSLLTSYAVNARLLIAAPVLLAGQLLMGKTFGTIVGHVQEAEILSPGAVEKMNGIVARLQRLRDSPIPKVLLIVFIYVYAIESGAFIARAQSWGVSGSGYQAPLTPAGVYYSFVSQVIYQFLLGVSVWEWMLWSYFLLRLSALDLQLLPTHPDHRGGLGFLGLSTIASTPLVLAACLTIGANWRTQILHGPAHVADFELQAAVLLSAVILLAVGPLVAFVPRLARVRRRGILEYGALAQLHSRDFHEKWIQHRAGREHEFLDAPEVSTLTDLATSFENIEKMRPLPYDKNAIAMLALAFLLPMLPVVLAEVRLATIFKALFQALK